MVLEVAFSERYRVGGENFVSNDLTLVLRFLQGIEAESRDFPMPTADETRWAKAPFRASNSMARAFILALAAMRPRNLTTGALVDTTSALSQYNKKEYHHVYPRAYLKREGVRGEHNAIANVCMLINVENNKVSDADPSTYLPRYIRDLGDRAADVFASNILPDPGGFDYAQSDYDAFLSARSALIASVVRQLCEGGREFLNS